MGLLDSIKRDAKRSGNSKGKFVYIKEGQKLRVRFLCDMDDGMEITFHDSFEQGINLPCQEHFGRDCKYCEDETLRTRSQYVWSVWDYDAKEVKLFMFPVNSFSPVPALVAMFENYGTLLDRDYVISRQGSQTSTSYSVVPMDKVKFRNDKAKPYSEKKILEMLDKAYPDDNADDEEEKPKKKSKSKAKKDIEDFDDDEVEKELFGDDNDYEDMSAKELYELCKERDIDALPKKSQKYYINLLEEYDEAQDDWGDDDDDEDDWEEDDE